MDDLTDFHDLNDDNNMIKCMNAIENKNTHAMFELAIFHEQKADYINMEKYYIMAGKLGCVDSLYNLAQYYEELYDGEKSVTDEKIIACYETIIEIDPKDTTAMEVLGWIYEENNDIDNMIKYMMMAVDKGDFMAMRHMANYHMKLKDYDKMMEFHMMAIYPKKYETMRYPSCPAYQSMHDLGLFYHKQKNYLEAIKYYTMACDGPNNYFSICGLIKIYQILDDDDNYVKYCLLLIEKHNDVVTMHNLACYYRTYRDYSNAIKYYMMVSTTKKSIFVSQDVYDRVQILALTSLVDLYLVSKQYDLMFEYCLMAMERFPVTTPTIMHKLGIYYTEQKDYTTAEKYFLIASDSEKNCERDLAKLYEKYEMNTNNVIDILKSQQAVHNYQINDLIECYDVHGNSKWYTCVVIDIDKNANKIFVHYCGWNNKFDEWIDLNYDQKRLAIYKTHTNGPRICTKYACCGEKINNVITQLKNQFDPKQIKACVLRIGYEHIENIKKWLDMCYSLST